MQIAILDVRQGKKRVASKSYTVSYRNLCVLKEYFNADLFVNADEINFNKDYDIIICGFGSTSCEKDKSTEFLIKNNKAKIYWLVGDYEQSTFAPLFYSKREFDVLKNYEHNLKNKKAKKQHFVNINTLLTKKSNNIIEKKYDCIYYGRWRNGRLKYFKEYLKENIYLSTHSKNLKLFYHNGCTPKMIKTMTWLDKKETLNLFKSTIYLEDKFTHSNYNCLGNRFYESLFCNSIPFFDKSCLNTLQRSKYNNYEDYVVTNYDDLIDKIKNIDNSMYSQTKKWNDIAIQEKKDTLLNIKKIFEDS